MSANPRNIALAETEPTATLLDDHYKQHSHMSTYSKDKALAETEPTAALPDDHS